MVSSDIGEIRRALVAVKKAEKSQMANNKNDKIA